MTQDQTASPVARFEDLLAQEDGADVEAPDAADQPAPENVDGDLAAADGQRLSAEDEVELPDETEAADPPGSIEVEIDGQARRLTAAEVRDGILMRADYTRKTQDLADQRRAFEAERQQVDTYLRQQLERLDQLEDPEPDWDTLYDEDPLGAPRIERDWRARQSQRHQALQHRALHQEQARQQHLSQQAALLPELIPEWSDRTWPGPSRRNCVSP